MTWYYHDGTKQSGPISEAELIELRRAGAITADNLVWREGMANWARYQEAGPAVSLEVPPAISPIAPAPLASTQSHEALCAECGKPFPKDEMIVHGSAYVCAACKPVFMQKLAEGVRIQPAASLHYLTEEELLAREYQVDIGRSFNRSWEMFQKNSGTCIVAALIVGGIMIGGGVLGGLGDLAIPLVSQIVPLFYTAPLLVGAILFFVRMLRNQQPQVGEVFRGFSQRYLPLLGYGVTEAVLTYIFLIPAFVMGVGMVFVGGKNSDFNPDMLPMFMGAILVFMLGAIYISTTLCFASQLILDKRYGVVDGIRLSFKMVHRRWWMTLAYMIVSGLALMAGALLCGVGLLVSGPIYLSMRAALYDDNFRDLMPRE